MLKIRPSLSLGRLLRDSVGAALVEFALLAPVLALLLLGLIDYSLRISTTMAVDRAAKAGADYAIAHGFAAQEVSAAVTGAIDSRQFSYMATITADPAPNEWCGCPDAATAGVETATCGSTCTSGSEAGRYATVSAQSTYQAMIDWPWQSPASNVVSTSTVVRIE